MFEGKLWTADMYIMKTWKLNRMHTYLKPVSNSESRNIFAVFQSDPLKLLHKNSSGNMLHCPEGDMKAQIANTFEAANIQLFPKNLRSTPCVYLVFASILQ
jgi:hypothetical protein